MNAILEIGPVYVLIIAPVLIFRILTPTYFLIIFELVEAAKKIKFNRVFLLKSS